MRCSAARYTFFDENESIDRTKEVPKEYHVTWFSKFPDKGWFVHIGDGRGWLETNISRGEEEPSVAISSKLVEIITSPGYNFSELTS